MTEATHREEFTLAYGSKRIGFHHGGEARQQKAGTAAGAEGWEAMFSTTDPEQTERIGSGKTL